MPKEVRQPTNHRRTSSVQAPIAPIPTGGPSSVRAQSSTWSAGDDEILMRARASGLNWQPIATKHFPSKTANACRKRHERLMERQKVEDWNGGKLELLATEYMNVREEMWKMLADRVGEKWRIVEEKCMEKGLKNLQQAFKSAQRKERGMDVDSGIGVSDAENDILDDGSGSGANSSGLSLGSNMSLHNTGEEPPTPPTTATQASAPPSAHATTATNSSSSNKYISAYSTIPSPQHYPQHQQHQQAYASGNPSPGSSSASPLQLQHHHNHPPHPHLPRLDPQHHQMPHSSFFQQQHQHPSAMQHHPAQHIPAAGPSTRNARKQEQSSRPEESRRSSGGALSIQGMLSPSPAAPGS